MMPGAFTSTRRRSAKPSIGAFAVDRVAQRVDDAAEQGLADRHVDDGAGPLDRIAFLDGDIRAEDHDADIVGFEVQRHALDAAMELDHLAGLHIVEAIDARDAVADGQDLADFADFRFGAEILDLALQDGGDFGRLDVHLYRSFTRIFYPGAGFNGLSSPRAGRSAWCVARNRSCANPLSRPDRREAWDRRARSAAGRGRGLDLSACLSSAVSWALSVRAEATSASISPCWRATQRLISADDAEQQEKPPLGGKHQHEPRAQRRGAHFVERCAAMPLFCSSRLNTRRVDEAGEVGAFGDHGPARR